MIETVEAKPKETPLLFNREMVQAVMSGRKTQTRRIVKPAPGLHPDDDGSVLYRCPYGGPGDRIWVRETWSYVTLCKGGDPWTAAAREDGTYREMPDGNPVMMVWRADTLSGAPTWSPSIHMPRWACRLLLEITNIKVERLQQVTEVDARREGVQQQRSSDTLRLTYKCGFLNTWSALYGKKAVKANPWVWAISFRKVTSA